MSFFLDPTRRGLQSKRLYEMQNDVLLAQSAVRTNTAIVTHNKKDFEKIGYFCPLHTVVYQDPLVTTTLCRKGATSVLIDDAAREQTAHRPTS
jgi:hypothetical protein